MEIYKVLMFGDRDWTLPEPIKREIRKAKAQAARRGAELVIIEGKAPGADQMAGHHAKLMDVHVAEVGALWETRHRGAGPQRNEIMKLLAPDRAVCFHPDLSKSKGSKDMAKRLDRAGISWRQVKR